MAMSEKPTNPSKWSNVHRFQVRTPTCHIVPVSRAYGGGGVPKVVAMGSVRGNRDLSLCVCANKEWVSASSYA